MPAAVAVVGLSRTVIFQCGVIPRFVLCAPLSSAYTVTRRTSVGRVYWTVHRGSRAVLNLGAFVDESVSADDDLRLAADLERLGATEARVRAAK